MLLSALSHKGARAAARKFSQNNAVHWKVYTQAEELIQRTEPGLFSKLLAVMMEADRMQWQSWKPSFNMRVVEYHHYIVGGGLTHKFHFDEGSALTMIVMLSRPEIDFTAGTFKTWEADETWMIHDLMQGDCLVIPSHKFHTVDKVTSGTRNVVVIEVWSGEEGKSDQRAITTAGASQLTGGDSIGYTPSNESKLSEQAALIATQETKRTSASAACVATEPPRDLDEHVAAAPVSPG